MKVKHIGNTVHSSLSDSEDCVSKCHVFNGAFNKLIGNFGNLSPDSV